MDVFSVSMYAVMASFGLHELMIPGIFEGKNRRGDTVCVTFFSSTISVDVTDDNEEYDYEYNSPCVINKLPITSEQDVSFILGKIFN